MDHSAHLRRITGAVATVLALTALATPPAVAGTDVRTPDGVVTDDVAALVRSADGGLVVRHYTTVADADPAEVLAAVRRRPGVVVADYDAPTAIATEPHRIRQWGLDRLRAEDAWALATGRHVTVAVLDTGVEARHPDLRHAVVAGADFTGARTDGRSDPRGHGTHVAGIVAASRTNGVGTAGLAPDARILPVRVLDADGAGKLSWAAQGLLWAVDHGADVVSLSLGASRTTKVMDAAVDYAVARGVVVVAASGNGGGNTALWPAADPDVISVGASTPRNTVASFSNGDRDLDVVAPGTQILSTCAPATWCWKQGTSMATPHVTAAVAALREVRPDLRTPQVRALLRGTATDLGPVGRDTASGSGLVGSLAALRTASRAPDPFRTSGTALRRVAEHRDSAVTAAVEMSRVAFPGGAGVAVLGRADVFADSLTGAALAGTAGPVLFTGGGPHAPLHPETAAELRRVLHPGSAVHVLGGPQAVSDRTLDQVRALGFSPRRIAGPTRTSTAALVADRVTGGKAEVDRVLVTRADHWADAVTGSAYAAHAGTPILLTGSATLDPAVATWLAGRDVAEVVVLGGQEAVSERVVGQLATRADRVRRVSGANRAATASAVADQLWGRRAGRSGDAFVVVEGYRPASWAPAVAAAVLSAGEGAPQLLVAAEAVPADTRTYLARLGYATGRPARVTAVGGGVGSRVGFELLPLIGR